MTLIYNFKYTKIPSILKPLCFTLILKYIYDIKTYCFLLTQYDCIYKAGVMKGSWPDKETLTHKIILSFGKGSSQKFSAHCISLFKYILSIVLYMCMELKLIFIFINSCLLTKNFYARYI